MPVCCMHSRIGVSCSGAGASVVVGAVGVAVDGAVVAYVTCSPHRAETTAVVDDVLAARPEVTRLRAAGALPEVPDCAVGDDVQLWPHRHGTDAMFLSLLRVSSPR